MSCNENCPKLGVTRLCHCGACHRTFSGVSTFDMHRFRGVCYEPTERFQMTLKGGVWGFHGTMPDHLKKGEH